MVCCLFMSSGLDSQNSDNQLSSLQADLSQVNLIKKPFKPNSPYSGLVNFLTRTDIYLPNLVSLARPQAPPLHPILHLPLNPPQTSLNLNAKSVENLAI